MVAWMIVILILVPIIYAIIWNKNDGSSPHNNDYIGW